MCETKHNKVDILTGINEQEISKEALKTRILKRLFHIWFWLTRSMTLGVRAAAFDESGKIFLVRHTYVAGWQMPGGGVERGQTAVEALTRELQEEGNLILLDKPELVSVYLNKNVTNRDHVVFFKCTVRQTAPKIPDREIAESGFFSLDALPAGITSATMKRLDEISGKKEISQYWSS